MTLVSDFAPCKLPLIIEWPRSCRYWAYRCVDLFTRRYSLSKTHFDGCQYGLYSIKAGHEHQLIKKSWTMASNIPGVHERLCECCKGHNCAHSHHPATGADVLNTQYYTPLIAIQIHLAIAEYFTKEVPGYSSVVLTSRMMSSVSDSNP